MVRYVAPFPQRPVLAEAHGERVATVDEDDLVSSVEAVAQAECCGDASEATSKHENTLHG